MIYYLFIYHTIMLMVYYTIVVNFFPKLVNLSLSNNIFYTLILVAIFNILPIMFISFILIPFSFDLFEKTVHLIQYTAFLYLGFYSLFAKKLHIFQFGR
jgi:hypothetical protein